MWLAWKLWADNSFTLHQLTGLYEKPSPPGWDQWENSCQITGRVNRPVTQVRHLTSLRMLRLRESLVCVHVSFNNLAQKVSDQWTTFTMGWGWRGGGLGGFPWTQGWSDSIFSSAWLRQQSSWYGVFVRRPCRNYLRTYWADSFQISVVVSPGPYPQTVFGIFEKKKCMFKFFRIFFFRFLVNQVNMGPYGSQKLQNFSVVLTKVLYWTFEILSFWFLRIFFRVDIGPYGSQNFETPLLPQITLIFESFQTFSEFSCQWSWQKWCFGLLKFWVFLSFTIFLRLHGTLWESNFETLPPNHFCISSNFSEFSSQWS